MEGRKRILSLFASRPLFGAPPKVALGVCRTKPPFVSLAAVMQRAARERAGAGKTSLLARAVTSLVFEIYGMPIAASIDASAIGKLS